MYEDGEPDECEVYIKRERTDRGNVVIYSFYKKNDGVAWNQEELERVSVLQTCLFAYNARVRLAQIADQFTFHDTQLGMYNLNFFMKHAGSLISDGRVENYGVCYFNLEAFFNDKPALWKRQGHQNYGGLHWKTGSIVG